MINLRPQANLSDGEVQVGLRRLMLDGVFSQVMGVLTGGAFLVAFAILLGASNTTIGFLAAIAPLTQVLQIPSIYLVDRIRMRKAMVTVSVIVGRLFWFVVAALPFLAPESSRVPLLLVALFVYFGLGSIAGCAFNSWMRDFIPEKVMGTYFARRMSIMVAIGAVLSLVGGVAVDFFKTRLDDPSIVYSVLFALGGTSGLLGAWFLSRVPEPTMQPAAEGSLLKVLLKPFRDSNFRKLILFLGSWNFAVTLSAPFFIVYMLDRLGLSMTYILALSVVSQLINVVFFPIWGRLADRFTNKSVLSVSGPLFIVGIFLWPFLTMPEKHFLTLPLLIAIHVLSGVSAAGVALCSGNIALKMAPKGAATAYLATNSLVSGIAATIAPILGGIAADRVAGYELGLDIRWVSDAVTSNIPALSISGLDFLFLASGILGLYAWHRLLAVREEGEVEEEIIVTELMGETRNFVRHVSNISGLRNLTYFPYATLRIMRIRANNNHKEE